MNLDISALYLFSSLVQADAAIVGLGIVFIVYKLQSLENRSQMAYQLLRSLHVYDSVVAPLVKQILDTDNPTFKGSALRNYLNNTYYKELELLVTVPLRSNIIKTEAFSSLKYISLHMFVCACAIIATPFLKDRWAEVPLLFLCLFILVYFWKVIQNIWETVRGVISNQKEFDLQTLSPEIYKQAHA